MMFWIVSICPDGAMFEIWLKPDELKASRTPSKIDDICRFLAGVDDGLDVPDWGWCP